MYIHKIGDSIEGISIAPVACCSGQVYKLSMRYECCYYQNKVCHAEGFCGPTAYQVDVFIPLRSQSYAAALALPPPCRGHYWQSAVWSWQPRY